MGKFILGFLILKTDSCEFGFPPPPTWPLIYTYREACRDVSLQKALSPFVSVDRNYRQWGCMRYMFSSSYIKSNFFSGSLKHFLLLDCLLN